MHKSVGAIIKKDNKYLMVDRLKPPFGFACLAGHVDEGETPEQALIREVKEESNLEVKKYKLLIHEFLEWNECSRGIMGHDWFVYECKVEGETKLKEDEAKKISWYSLEEIKKLNLEPAWKHWFEKLKIL